MDLFHTLVAAHIVTGSLGALAFWVPVLGRKGGVDHRRWGRIFTRSLLLTGGLAIVMSLLTLYDPIGTHPQLEGRFEAGFIRGIFGWMMLHVGVLTLNLVWYGWSCIRNGRRREQGREWRNLSLQGLVLVTSGICVVEGMLLGQPLMLGIAGVGIATAATNLWYLYKPRPGPMDWLKEHVKALIGAGISVYTAFMAFGSVRILPELALNPLMWAIPLFSGIAMILWHWRRIGAQARPRTATA